MAVYPPSKVRIAPKICQNAFQTICNILFFGTDFFFSGNFFWSGKRFFINLVRFLRSSGRTDIKINEKNNEKMNEKNERKNNIKRVPSSMLYSTGSTRIIHGIRLEINIPFTNIENQWLGLRPGPANQKKKRKKLVPMPRSTNPWNIFVELSLRHLTQNSLTQRGGVANTPKFSFKKCLGFRQSLDFLKKCVGWRESRAKKSSGFGSRLKKFR